MEAILNWVKTIVIYMLFVSALTHLLPEDSYKKYMRFVAGLVLMILVLRPVSDVLIGDGTLDSFYEKALQWQNREEYSRMRTYAAEAQEETMLRAYERKTAEQIKQELENQGYPVAEIRVALTADELEEVTISLDESEETQGEVKDRIIGYLQKTYGFSPQKIEVQCGKQR